MFRIVTNPIQKLFVFLTLVFLVLPAAMGAEKDPSASSEQKIEFRGNVQVPMRDGVLLTTDLFLPRGNGPFPAVLVRTPYSAVLDEEFHGVNKVGRELAALGFACIVQDCRGTGDSQGVWEPYFNERQDGIDTHKWVLGQPWCNGRIAVYGDSYLGYTQWALTPHADDSLKAGFAFVPTFDWYQTNYSGGAFRLRMVGWHTAMYRPRSGDKPAVDSTKWQWDEAYRHLPLRTWDEQIGTEIPWLRNTIAHPEFDGYWAGSRITDELHHVAVPSLTISGWYDLFLNQALRYVPLLHKEAANETARRHQHLIIGPWGHIPNERIGELTFGDEAKIDLERIRDQWFGHWLKEEAAEVNEWPFLRIFVMGANVWRNENGWPLARTRSTPYYFHSGGSANTLGGDGKLGANGPGAEASDRYVYDPKDPMPTHGGEWTMSSPCGSLDQRKIEEGRDVLVYTSEPLAEPLEVTGPVKVVLYAASSAPDTDWTAKLVDVHPDGRAFNLCDGIIRARYRESLTKAKLITPNEVHRYEIDLWATSNVFLPGHRIRVEISSSNFPRFDRNPNTGHKFGADAELVVARQTVYHDKEHPSHIVLPVIPR